MHLLDETLLFTLSDGRFHTVFVVIGAAIDRPAFLLQVRNRSRERNGVDETGQLGKQERGGRARTAHLDICRNLLARHFLAAVESDRHGLSTARLPLLAPLQAPLPPSPLCAFAAHRFHPAHLGRP